MSETVDLAPAAAQIRRLTGEIPDERLDSPTPCADTPVKALLSHILMLSHAFRMAAAKAPDPGPPPADQPRLPADWRSALPAAVDAMAEAWTHPDAQVGTTSAGGVQMPAPVAATVALDELVLHGWDLARATGRPYRPDPTSIEICLGFVSSAASPEGVPGLFGPPVPVPPDAPALDRLLGLSGRNPGWSPPASG